MQCLSVLFARFILARQRLRAPAVRDAASMGWRCGRSGASEKRVYTLSGTARGNALLHRNRAKIPGNLLALRSQILKRADFGSIEAQNAGNPFGFTSVLTTSERKSVFLKRVRVTLLTLARAFKPESA